MRAPLDYSLDPEDWHEDDIVHPVPAAVVILAALANVAILAAVLVILWRWR